MKREPRHRPLIRRWLAGVVERALQRVPTPDPRSLAVLPYLRAGLAVPAKIAAAADEARDDCMPVAMWAAAAALFAARDHAESAASAAAIVADSRADHWERYRQLADLLKLVKKEMP
jgi:hypothetical protein